MSSGSPRGSSSAGRQLLALSAGWLLLQLGRQLLPPLLPAIIEDFAITSAEAGFALTVMWLAFALVHYPAGLLSDRLSRKTVVAAGLVVSGAGFALLSGALAFEMLVLAAAVIGAGTGLYFMGMRVLLALVYDEGRGRAFGVNMAAGNVGAILAAGLAATVVAGTAWRLAFLPVALSLVAILAALHVVVPESYRLSRVDFDLRPTTARVFGTPGIRGLLAAYTLFVFSWQGVLGFLPTFLQVGNGYSAAVAGVGFAIPFATGLVVMPFAGMLSDRVPAIYVIAGAPLVAATGLVGMVLGASAVVVLAWTTVFSVGLMSFPPAMQPLVMARFPDDSVGGEFGIFKTVYSGVASLGPTYVGLVVTAWSYAAAFASLAACMLAAAGISYVHLRGE